MCLNFILENIQKKISYYKKYFKDFRIKKVFIELFLSFFLCGKTLVSELARFNTTLKATHNKADRLYRFLERDDLPIESIWKDFLFFESYKVHEDSLIIYDFTDVSKTKRGDPDYHYMFENIGKVHDGSENVIHNGYAVRCSGVYRKGEFSPLQFKLCSYSDKDFTSENDWITQDFDEIFAATQHRGVLVLDRGFDRDIILTHLINNNYSFIMRITTKRHYMWGEKNRFFHVEEILRHIARFGKGDRPVPGIYHTTVHLRFEDQPLTLVAVVPKRKTKKTNRKKEVMYFLTNRIIHAYSGAYQVLKDYLKRWSIENYFQMIKRKYDLEKFMIRKIKGILMMMTIVMIGTAIAYDEYNQLDNKQKKTVNSFIQSLRPKYKYYIIISFFLKIGKIIDAKAKMKILDTSPFKNLFRHTYG